VYKRQPRDSLVHLQKELARKFEVKF